MDKLANPGFVGSNKFDYLPRKRSPGNNSASPAMKYTMQGKNEVKKSLPKRKARNTLHEDHSGHFSQDVRKPFVLGKTGVPILYSDRRAAAKKLYH